MDWDAKEENEEANDNQLLFQSVPDVVIPSKHDVPLYGLQKLPKRFLQNSVKLREDFRFRIQPTRITSENGILVSLRFQIKPYFFEIQIVLHNKSFIGFCQRFASPFLFASSGHNTKLQTNK